MHTQNKKPLKRVDQKSGKKAKTSTKFIFISGGVISGVGKGIAASSIGFLLKSHGIKVSMMKADPYVNVDAGTMNPLEHGETFVLEDGLETDMDMGHYERFLDETFTKTNYMTTGSIYSQVLKNEREMKYKGKCVQVYTHVPQQIISQIENSAEKTDAQVVIIEIGGTAGEYESELFLEANRVMKLQRPNDVIHIHVAYLPIPSKLGEMKTKPTQISVRFLNKQGISPDFILARSVKKPDDIRREKISYFCNIPKEHIIAAPDVNNVYKIPINFQDEKIVDKICNRLNIKFRETPLYHAWKKKIKQLSSSQNKSKKVHISIIGKYYKSGDFDLKDAYVSVIEAIKHACWAQNKEADIKWYVSDNFENDKEAQKELVEKSDGIIVPQGWGSRGTEGKIKAIQLARENKIPYLGLCFGMQMAIIEYARNVLGIKDANSEEVDPTSKNHVIHLMEYQKSLMAKNLFGGTIRLGAYPCQVTQNSQLENCYKKFGNYLFNLPEVAERHRHRYEFNNLYRKQLEDKGLVIAGTSPDGSLVEAIELPKSVHPFFVGTQYHPELKSRFMVPHPIFMGFINACWDNRKYKGEK